MYVTRSKINCVPWSFLCSKFPIPSFQWFQTEYQLDTSRHLHTCHTTNTNQLIIIGGLDPGSGGWELFSPKEFRDPWPEAIGIFDMTNLKDKDSYEAKAKPYEPPELIKSFYKDKYAKIFSILNFFFFFFFFKKKSLRRH